MAVLCCAVLWLRHHGCAVAPVSAGSLNTLLLLFDLCCLRTLPALLALMLQQTLHASPPCPADQCRVHNVTAHSCEPGCPPCQQRPAPKQWATYESCSEQSFAPTCVNLSGPLRERSWRHCAHSSRFRFHHGMHPTPMASRRHRAHPAAAQLQVLARTEIAHNTQRTAIQALSCKAKRLQAPYLGRTAPPRRRHRPAADLDLLQQNKRRMPIYWMNKSRWSSLLRWREQQHDQGATARRFSAAAASAWQRCTGCLPS